MSLMKVQGSVFELEQNFQWYHRWSRGLPACPPNAWVQKQKEEGLHCGEACKLESTSFFPTQPWTPDSRDPSVP